MNLKSVKLAYSSENGQLNDAKIKRLEQFKDKYPVIARQEGGPGVLLMNPNDKSTIAILPDRIVFDYNGENLNIENIPVESDLHRLTETLILDRTAKTSIQFIAQQNEENEDAMSFSLSFLPSITDIWNEVSGLGLRLLFEASENQMWEVKIEPLLRNIKQFHLEGICNYKTLSVEELSDQLTIAYNFFKEETNKYFQEGIIN